MAEPMTMERARQLRTQDCPLPALAGPAIKLLFERIEFLEDAMRAAARTLEADADEHGVAAALRLAIGEQPRLIGAVDMACEVASAMREGINGPFNACMFRDQCRALLASTKEPTDGGP